MKRILLNPITKSGREQAEAMRGRCPAEVVSTLKVERGHVPYVSHYVWIAYSEAVPELGPMVLELCSTGGWREDIRAGVYPPADCAFVVNTYRDLL